MRAITKKATPRGPAAPRAAPHRSPPYLRFFISAALRAQTLAAITAIEKANKPGEHRKALMDAVVALSDAGSSYFFLRPLALSKPGFAIEQLARLSMGANQRLVASAVRTVMERLDDRHLVFVGKYIRELML